MDKNVIAALAILAAATAWASPSLGQEIACQTKYHTSSTFSGEAPGTLETPKNTPCILSRHIGGGVRGRAPGQAGGIAIVQPPKSGTVQVVNRSSLIFTPKPGFAGADTMLVRMGYAGGKSGLVRFAIAVD